MGGSVRLRASRESELLTLTRSLEGRTYWLGWAHFISCSWVGRCEQECGRDPDQASQTHWVSLMTHYAVLPRAPHISRRCSMAQEHKVSLTAHQLKWAWQPDTLAPMENGMACASGAEHKPEIHRHFPRRLDDNGRASNENRVSLSPFCRL